MGVGTVLTHSYRQSDRKRKIMSSQHCWFCNALIKLCWRLTQRRGTDRKQYSYSSNCSQQSGKLPINSGVFKIFLAGRSCLSTVSQLFSARHTQKSQAFAGSVELRWWPGPHFVWDCRAFEAAASSCCFSMTQHFWIVRNTTGKVERRTPGRSQISVACRHMKWST